MRALRRSPLALLALIAAGAGWLFLRRRGLPAERIDIYLSDGELITFEGGSTEAERFLPLAREILSLAR